MPQCYSPLPLIHEPQLEKDYSLVVLRRYKDFDESLDYSAEFKQFQHLDQLRRQSSTKPIDPMQHKKLKKLLQTIKFYQLKKR
jgi:hypothetical protein